MSFDICNSVNVDRRPDLRVEILSGTFQAASCPDCGTEVSIPPLLTYLDVARGQWILAKPAAQFDEWPALEAVARETFAASFGVTSPRAAQQVGTTLRPRVVFGWAALREKLLAAEHGIDDVDLELLKLALTRTVSNLPFDDATEARLGAVTGDVVVLQWRNIRHDSVSASLAVPRAALAEIAANPSAWAPLRQRLGEGPFVDMSRLLTLENRDR